VTGVTDVIDTSRPTENGTPVLRVSGLQYAYPSGLQALGGIDMELRAGELIAIVGPSGCGKSTFLSMIAGLALPTGGEISWDEDQLPPGEYRQHLAMLFQRDTVFPWRTVEKNIQFGMECLDLPKDQRQEWTDRLLEMGGLTAFRKSYPRALSGGMRRRVGLLTALAVRPSILLLDEPFAALDEPTRVEMLGDVLKLVYEYNVSVMLVTHDLAEAISIADRIFVLSNRPATVDSVFPVTFGHDRDIVKLRERPQYASIYSQLWHKLWSVIRSGDAETAALAAQAPGDAPPSNPGLAGPDMVSPDLVNPSAEGHGQ
jgi:NitT/TauT family transport system ATP-binding protein